jgi:hypothetical protein
MFAIFFNANIHAVQRIFRYAWNSFPVSAGNSPFGGLLGFLAGVIQCVLKVAVHL